MNPESTPAHSTHPTILYVTPFSGDSNLVTLLDQFGDKATCQRLVLGDQKARVFPRPGPDPFSAVDQADLVVFHFFRGESSDQRSAFLMQRLLAGKPLIFLSYARDHVPALYRAVIDQHRGFPLRTIVWGADTAAVMQEIMGELEASFGQPPLV